MTEPPLTFAVPKGRMLKPLIALFNNSGIDADALKSDDRRLVKPSADGRFRFLLLKPDDVPTYVEYGAADVGVSGRDVLLERDYGLYQPLDLGMGVCRMVVAGPKHGKPRDVPRVATKYPSIAAKYFQTKGTPVEIVFVQGSVELAPLVGLADLIVDIVETGSTLKENDLVIKDEIHPISSVVVVNRAQFKLRSAAISALLKGLRAGLVAQSPAQGAQSPG